MNDVKTGLTRREKFEAQQRRRSLLIAATSTVLVVAAIVVLVPLAPGWEKVQKSFFNGEVLAKSFPKLLDAFLVNIMMPWQGMRNLRRCFPCEFSGPLLRMFFVAFP